MYKKLLTLLAIFLALLPLAIARPASAYTPYFGFDDIQFTKVGNEVRLMLDWETVVDAVKYKPVISNVWAGKEIATTITTNDYATLVIPQTLDIAYVYIWAYDANDVEVGFTSYLFSYRNPYYNPESVMTKTSVHRFWSDQNMTHFYTASTEEKDYVVANYPQKVWKYEGVAFAAGKLVNGVCPEGTFPLYRFWSDQNQSHFYTISIDEKYAIEVNYPKQVWSFERNSYCALRTPAVGSIPVYRFWSDQNMTHFYTTSEAEKNYIVANYPTRVWNYEGVAFYTYP